MATPVELPSIESLARQLSSLCDTVRTRALQLVRQGMRSGLTTSSFYTLAQDARRLKTLIRIITSEYIAESDRISARDDGGIATMEAVFAQHRQAARATDIVNCAYGLRLSMQLGMDLQEAREGARHTFQRYMLSVRRIAHMAWMWSGTHMEAMLDREDVVRAMSVNVAPGSYY